MMHYGNTIVNTKIKKPLNIIMVDLTNVFFFFLEISYLDMN